MEPKNLKTLLGEYPLLDAFRHRRSRRFALGMKMQVGPMKYTSQHPPFPLTEAEEALLAFAACGITGYALAELIYDVGQGGTMMAGFLGRTVSSADAAQAVFLVVTNDEATYLLKRPQDIVPSEFPELVRLVERGEFEELYQRTRIKIMNGRSAPPLHSPYNLDCNQWDLYAKGTTYFLPINEYTYMYINGLLEFLNETMAVFIVDERAGFRPAGLGPFAKSKGGHLIDDPQSGRILTIERAESILQSVVTIEQGMMLQNLGLMAQAIGLGGFPNFAGHEFTWFEELGFRMEKMPAMHYLGASRLVQLGASLMRKNVTIPYPVGLERDGKVLLKPYCPPYYETMEAAVQAVVDRKFGREGIFRGKADYSAWCNPGGVLGVAPEISQAAINATIAYCSYIYETYGRFPAYPAPFRTGVGFQAGHLDLDFYDRFYHPQSLSETQQQHMMRWHSAQH